MNQLLSKRIIIEIRNEEAEALYGTGINNECPYKHYNPDRKIWWALMGPGGRLPFTLCQECYHNNIFGDKDASIKPLLKPLLLVGVPCNCDGRKMTEGFPINFGNGWMMGIYTQTPKIGIVGTEYVYSNDKFSIDAVFPHEKCDFMLNFHTETITDANDIVCEIRRDVDYKTLIMSSATEDGGINLNVLGNPGLPSLMTAGSYFNFKFDRVTTRDKFTVRIFSQTGTHGSVGSVGSVGPVGPVGSVGAVGPPGAVGPVGVPGASGVPGVLGVSGMLAGYGGFNGLGGLSGLSALNGSGGPSGNLNPAWFSGLNAPELLFSVGPPGPGDDEQTPFPEEETEVDTDDEHEPMSVSDEWKVKSKATRKLLLEFDIYPRYKDDPCLINRDVVEETDYENVVVSI